jgi:hypothetical protein
MSSPHSAGVIALTWQMDKSLTNVQVQNLVTSWATPNVIDGASLNGGGKNLLFSLINPFVPAPPPVMTPVEPSPSNSSISKFILSNLLLILFTYIL